MTPEEQRKADDGPFPFIVGALMVAVLALSGFMIVDLLREKHAEATAPVVSLVQTRPHPYLTPKAEYLMARDNCTITKQRCRKDNVCETCMVCPHEGRQQLGWTATKCKSPTDCTLLETNVDWEREDTNPGWCEGVEDNK